MIRLLDHTGASPGENLALEEVILDEVEQGRQPDTLRFWESPTRFVVLGTGQVLAQEVNEGQCAADGVPIHRRCSAGGCVLQGPGSLNYALFLRYERHPDLRALHPSYHYILGMVCTALGALGVTAEQAGISDIAVAGRKISGNAQRRRRRALLHHGTLLYRADGDGMRVYLQEPVDRPDYRGARSHDAFVSHLDHKPEALRRALQEALAPDAVAGTPEDNELAAARSLARSKYDTRAWIYRR